MYLRLMYVAAQLSSSLRLVSEIKYCAAKCSLQCGTLGCVTLVYNEITVPHFKVVMRVFHDSINYDVTCDVVITTSEHII